MTSIEQLIRIASPSISGDTADLDLLADLPQQYREWITELMADRNGYYAFESALQVFPVNGWSGDHPLLKWNDPQLWRNNFPPLPDKLFFFAQDLFGCQFAFLDNSIVSFNPETAEIEHMADNIDEWAGLILADHEALTGFPLAHQWQSIYGPIQKGQRLVPKIPFVAGGQFTIENLHALDAVKAMRFYGHLATQIKDLPDGATIKFSVKD